MSPQKKSVKDVSADNQNDLTAPGGSDEEEMENAAGRVLQRSLIEFEKLCDANRNEGDTEMIYGVEWKVYRSELAFDDLFWAYWRGIREQWKEEFSLHPERYDKRRIEAELADVCSQIKEREDKFHAPDADEHKLRKELHVLGEKRMDLEQRKRLVERVNDDDAWKKYGQSMLASWKKDGVPRANFLALASGYFDFERGVKFITGENRLERSLPWFRRFLKSRVADEDKVKRAMEEYREKAFGSVKESYLLKEEFAKWKCLEKSRLAQESRKARGKRGRVKSKSDERLGGRPPSLST